VVIFHGTQEAFDSPNRQFTNMQTTKARDDLTIETVTVNLLGARGAV
jgi:hypothetical protein